MESLRDEKLSEMQDLQEYQRQLTAMLAYLDKRLQKPLLLELTAVGNQISRLRSEICPNGRNRTGQLSRKGRCLW